MTNEEIIQHYADLVGTPYDDRILDRIRVETGRERVHGPNDITTKEYDANRVHVMVDSQGLITGIAFN